MFKTLIKKIFTSLHIDITKNLKYDRLTKKIMNKTIQIESNCIDIGCHKGEILDIILKYSPNGKHFAFEPIPKMFSDLQLKYGDKCKVFPYALSDKIGKTSFTYVKNAPAYSGILKRKYDISNPDIEMIEVDKNKLDNLIPENIKIDFIKIDVEGGEFHVLKGGENTIVKNKPIIIFEFGLGASEFYGTKPENLFDFLSDECKMDISTLQSWLKNEDTLSKQEFNDLYFNNTEYYFIAHPQN